MKEKELEKKREKKNWQYLKTRNHRNSGGGIGHSGLSPSHAAPLGADPTEGDRVGIWILYHWCPNYIMYYSCSLVVNCALSYTFHLLIKF